MGLKSFLKEDYLFLFLKFIYPEKATKFCKISIVDLTVTRPGNRATLGLLRYYFYYCRIVGLVPVIPYSQITGSSPTIYYNKKIGAQRAKRSLFAQPTLCIKKYIWRDRNGSKIFTRFTIFGQTRVIKWTVQSDFLAKKNQHSFFEGLRPIEA